MEIKFTISQLKSSAGQRPTGFVDFVLSRGKTDGQYVLLEEEALSGLHEKFPLHLMNQHQTQGRFHLNNVKAATRRRPPGYFEFVLARGKVEGDFVTLDETALKEVREQFPSLPPPPRLPEPTVAEMAANLTQAMTAWVQAGFKVVDREIYETRHATCLSCEYWDAPARAGLGKCKKCGCTRIKLWLATTRCPLKPPKW